MTYYSSLAQLMYLVVAKLTKYRCKEIESPCDSMSLLNTKFYKLIHVGCHGINSMTLTRVDDMNNVSSLI